MQPLARLADLLLGWLAAILYRSFDIGLVRVFSAVRISIAAPPPALPALAPPNQGDLSKVHGNHPPRAIRCWNNENYCSSYGFDVAEWHNSHTCPPSCRRPDHNEQATRANTMGGSEKHSALVGL